jgi:hypothetical protein
MNAISFVIISFFFTTIAVLILREDLEPRTPRFWLTVTVTTLLIMFVILVTAIISGNA